MRKLSALAAVAASSLMLAGAANASLIYGIDQHNVLFTFDSANPTAVLNAQRINYTGAANANGVAVGIDFRPADGKLYIMTDFGEVFSSDQSGGFNATAASTGSLSVALSGTSFGFDFNPVPDRLRVTSDTDQNLRHQIGAATLVDGLINGSYGNPSVVGAAYLNPDNDPSTGTTLYTIDSLNDSLNIQNPPNNGTQVVQGPLGIDVNSEEVGFDIEVGTNIAYLAANVGGDHRSNLYTVDKVSGAATLVGQIGNGTLVRDITVVIPEPATAGVLAIAGLLAARRRK